MKLSIVIPVYNEEKYIDAVIERILAVRFQPGVTVEIIAVNDCSRDKTLEHLRSWEEKGIRVASHAENGGKGAALHTGFAMATGDVITVQDSDFEYNPEELPRILQPILDDRAEIVFGARKQFITKTGSHHGLFCGHYLINKFLTMFSNLFSHYGLNDMECCYKMFTRSVYERIKLCEKRFGFEPEITLKTSRLKLKYTEIPVSYSSRSYEEGKKINWKDGVSAVRCIMKYGLFHK